MQVLRPELDDVIISPFAVIATFASQGATLVLTLCCFCGVSNYKGVDLGHFLFLEGKRHCSCFVWPFVLEGSLKYLFYFFCGQK